MTAVKTRLWSLAILVTASFSLAHAAPAEAQLAANERLQGTMEIDVGNGPVTMRSVATLIDADLGAKTAARLKSAEGQKSLADAKNRMQSSGSSAAGKVTAADIQALADSSAGKTVYSSEAIHLKIINAYGITLDAKAPDGSRAQLSMRLGDKNLSVQDAKFSYIPDAKRLTQEFVSPKKGDPVQVKIDKIERVGDKGFAISGSFTATNLGPGVLAKDLTGKSIAKASGRFDFQEVALRKN
ncbi:MAG: hypothetical protein ABI564_15560 [Ideonella sp.]